MTLCHILPVQRGWVNRITQGKTSLFSYLGHFLEAFWVTDWSFCSIAYQPPWVIVLYTHDLHNSMNKRNTFLIKKISHFTLCRAHSLPLVWEIDGETYTQREDFFPYLLPGARCCQRLHPLASSSETPLIGCVSLARLRFSAPCLKLTVWFSSRDPQPVTHLFDLSALTRRHLPVY